MKTIKMLMVAILTILSVSVFAQDTMQKSESIKHKSEKVRYSCPMHPEVTRRKPGKCPKCRMSMTRSPKEIMKIEVMRMYACPMKCEGDKTYDKPGKCPKCGMDLTLSPKEKMKRDVMKTYTCPMHADVTSKEPGKCPKCGMELTQKK